MFDFVDADVAPATFGDDSAKPVTTVADLRIRPIIAVPEGLAVAKLLNTLQRERTKIAVVVDEHGGTSGIVTMSDIMEQIVGRINDEYVHGGEGGVVKIAEGSYLIDGSLPIDEVIELVGFTPDEADECETAGGLLLALFDRIPEVGDEIDCGPAHFTIVEMDNLRIEKVRVLIAPPATER